MKFTDGYWLIRKGFQPHYASQVYDWRVESKEVQLDVTTRVIRHRGDTLQGPILDVRLSSPMPDVIRVQAEHFSGGHPKKPTYPLFAEPVEIDTQVSDDHIVVKSGRLEARLKRGDSYQLDFLGDGKVITSSKNRSLGYVKSDAGENFLHEQLSLDVGELVYGLGERFTSFVKNGQVVDTWNEDGGTGSEQAYKSVPFYMTNRGYGVFVNESGPVSFEVASEKVSRVQFSLPSESLDYFVIYGPTPAEVLEKYTRLTGRPSLPPAWSFGLWLTTSFTTNYDEETVTSFVNGFKERNIPLHTFHFDCFWMKGFHWCDLQWDSKVFPDPKGMLERLHKMGLKICVWINPYIAQKSPMFAEGKEKGYFLKRADGSVWQWDMWQPGMAIVDFTNPAACEWYGSRLRDLLDMGVDSFKTDFGERIPTDAVYFDGSDPVTAHNFYPYRYNKLVFEVLKEKRGEGEAVLFARSATAGCQQFPVHWGGDCYSDFPSMAESLRGGLSLSTCGFGFWSHDIGGFEGLPPASIYKRWVAFGLLSSHSRLHGSSSYRVPWLYDDEACDVVRSFTELKCRLMPYLFASGVVARDQGTPMMRPMFVAEPSDPACDTLDRQYMLGPNLLVAPVLSESGDVDLYLPRGKWTHWFTGERREGGQWHRESHGFLTAAVWVKPNSLVAVGSNSQRPDYDYAEGVQIRCYEIAGEASVVVPNVDSSPALTANLREQNGAVSAELDGNWKSAEFLFVNRTAFSDVEGAIAEQTLEGVKVVPSGTTFKITLS